MARARAIETRLEKLVPALDEYYSSGFLTRDETVEVSRQRQHWEFRLVAKPLLLLDVRGAIAYELALEKRLREYCIHTKLNLQHRWDIVDRIEGIYKIGLKHLRNKTENEALRQECVLFMKQFQRNGSLSNLYGELMVMHPRRSDIWVEAATWQGFSQRNTDNARAITQQALLTMASEPAVWACALRVELQFVQRLLEGLLADHRDELREARKRAAHTGEDGDVSVTKAIEDEATSSIAPKLRAENEAMAHVLLDLALAKTVVEEAFESPASGAALLVQLLEVAGTYAFAREVLELAVTTAAHKMAEACNSSDGATSEVKRVRGPRGVSGGSPLTIATDQQRLRVRTQWCHQHSIDTVFAHYLSLEDFFVNRFSTPIVDTTTYLAEGGGKGSVSAKRRGPQEQPHPSPATTSFLSPSQEDRRRAAVKAVASMLTFSATATSALVCLPGVVDTDTDSATRFPAVRQAFVEALRRVAAVSPEGVSRLCLHLLRSSVVAATDTTSVTAATNKGKKKKKDASRSGEVLDITAAIQGLLGGPQLDDTTLQTCAIEPQERTRCLLKEMSLTAEMHPRAKSRARHEVTSSTSPTATLMTWSVAQLGRLLQEADRDALVEVSGTSVGGTTSTSPHSLLKGAPAMTAEDVERFIVWWKDEEKKNALGDSLVASQACRRAAVMRFLIQHGLLPSVELPAGPEKHNNSKRKTLDRASSNVTDEDAWAKTRATLLNRTSALRFVPATGTSIPARVPLSLWRVFSALETLEGPAQMRERVLLVHTTALRAGSDESDSDDTDDGVVRDSGVAAGVRSAGLSSASLQPSCFAAAGLFFLSGVPHSTLSREEEWLRLEGVTSLLRCRLASWMGRRVCTRDTVAETLQSAASDLAAAWIDDMQGLLALAQRCQPLPRFAQTHCVLPFLEGVALFRSAPEARSSQGGHRSSAAKVSRDAMQAAREAHETLLRLYDISKQPESFLPLIYDGTSTEKLTHPPSASSNMSGKASKAEVQQANAEDWVSYVLFERTVSNDLLKAKTVVEQARRTSLAPQIFMARLSAL